MTVKKHFDYFMTTYFINHNTKSQKPSPADSSPTVSDSPSIPQESPCDPPDLETVAMAADQKKKTLRLTDGKQEESSYDLKSAPGKYEKICLLHEGPRAEVWQWRRRSDNRLFAVKSYSDEGSEGQDSMPMEVCIFKEVLPPHHGIVNCENWRIVPPRNLDITFDFYEGGDLGTLIDHDTDIGRSEDFIWNVVVQIADVLAFLRKHSSLFLFFP